MERLQQSLHFIIRRHILCLGVQQTQVEHFNLAKLVIFSGYYLVLNIISNKNMPKLSKRWILQGNQMVQKIKSGIYYQN